MSDTKSIKVQVAILIITGYLWVSLCVDKVNQKITLEDELQYFANVNFAKYVPICFEITFTFLENSKRRKER